MKEIGLASDRPKSKKSDFGPTKGERCNQPCPQIEVVADVDDKSVNIERMLPGFRGTLQYDAYICYELTTGASLDRIKPAACRAPVEALPVRRRDHISTTIELKHADLYSFRFRGE